MYAVYFHFVVVGSLLYCFADHSAQFVETLFLVVYYTLTILFSFCIVYFHVALLLVLVAILL